MKSLVVIFILLLPAISFSQDKDAQAIRKVLQMQVEAWNNGNMMNS
jgi:hypothetical protein